MIFIKSLLLCFSMYSKIPMPHIEWKDENMRYVLMCFPLVGLVQGILFLLCFKLLSAAPVDNLLKSTLLTALPILYNGAIHIDGFMDTVDALSSQASRERKLDILKDSHIGAFAAIGISLYLIIYVVAMNNLSGMEEFTIFALSFISIRAYSIFALMILENARGSGYVASFVNAGIRNTTLTFIIIAFLLASSAMLYVSIRLGTIVISAQAISFIYIYYICKSKFGGMTGDLAGFLLQFMELVSLLCLAFV